MAPVGIRCPDHAGTRRVVKPSARRAAHVRRSDRRARDEGADRDQRPRLSDRRGPAGRELEQSHAGAGLLRSTQPRSPPLAVRAGRAQRRLVAAHHRGVPARQPHPHRVQHVRALGDRAARRELPRTLPLPRSLSSSPASQALPVRCSRRPNVPTVGASGAIFGILGAMLILEWQVDRQVRRRGATMIVINLAIGFAYNGAGGNISIGGHVGGLVGGVLVRARVRELGLAVTPPTGRCGLTGQPAWCSSPPAASRSRTGVSAASRSARR